MPVDPHPIEAAFEGHDDQDMIAYGKLHERVVVADTDEVRNTDFSGQYGGLYIRSKAANYNIDTEETGADDDDSIVIDGAGNHFVKTVDSQTKSGTSHTVSTSSLTIADDDTFEIHRINNTSGGAIDVFLPDVTVRTKPIRIIDAAGNAATYNITVKPKAASGQTIMTGSSFVIDSNGASFGADPDTSGENWE